MTLEEIKKLLDETIRASQVENSKSLDSVLGKYFKEGGNGNKFLGEGHKEEKTGFKNLGEMAVAAWKAAVGKGVDERLITKAPTGMNEADDTAGGFLVQSDIADQMIQNLVETGLLASRCKRIPISAKSNSLVINGLDETSRANGSRYGGIQAYWENEADQLTGTKPKFRQMRLWLKKLTGMAYVTDELLQDTVALDAWLRQAFEAEFGFKLDDAIINGVGSGQPLGVMNAPCLVTIAKETDQDAATFNAKNAVKMFTALPAKNRASSVWLCNAEVEEELPFLKIEGSAGGVTRCIFLQVVSRKTHLVTCWVVQ